MIVIDKPAGMVVHPAPGNFTGTLVHALLHHCKDLTGINGVLRPGIVHRLDKETSGVMVVAKSDEAFQHLTKQFKNRTLDKVYLAIARGTFQPEEGVIDLPVGRHPKERKRMCAPSPRGREAVTDWKVLERFRGAMFLELHPRTGRTHQIRVHLAAVGHPVLGDPLYGRGKGMKDPLGHGKKLQRHALHAYRLGLTHPLSGKKVEFISPVPQDMKTLLDQLRSEVPKG
jgi:23S rRNA pseudouridine1911/1915/1917 synthase